MIRRARLTDIALIRKMAENAVWLDCESKHIQGPQEAKHIVAEAFGLLDTAETVVWCREGTQATGFAQFVSSEPGAVARVSCLGLRQEDSWLRPAASMLESLVIQAGFAGLKIITAEVNENENAFKALRKAGFVVYARQAVYAAKDIGRKNNIKHKANISVTKNQTEDRAETHKLYNSIVPDLAKQTEEAPSNKDASYVIRNNGVIVGMFIVSEGPIGIWIKPYLYPEVCNEVGECLSEFVVSATHRHKKPTYVRARSYQPWLGGVLKDAGFSLLSTQAVVAKRTTARVADHELVPISKLVTSDSDTAVPVVKINTQNSLFSKQNERPFETRNL